MDLALWKAESQVPRSDTFHHEDDPGPLDDSVPHTKNIIGDDEHRYRGGIALAWYLTGDERFRDALLDEAEVLPGLKIWAQERSMYQTLVALAEVADATHQWAALDPVVAERVGYYGTPLIDIPACVDGFGWDGPPGAAPRGCYVYSEQSVSEKPPGENYITRGFITASMGPRALYRAARHLQPADPAAQLASLRLRDLARYTRDELFPFVANPLDRHLVYSYGVKLEVVNTWEQSDFHPILLGMAEAWRQTGDPSFLLKGLEQIEAFEAHGNLEWMDRRLEAQHYLRAVLDAPVPGAYYWVVVPTVTLLTLLPVSLNGMGVREWGMTLFLVPLGVPAGTAVSLAFLWFAVFAACSLANICASLSIGPLP